MKFNDLSIQEKAAVIKLGVGSGLRSLQQIEDFYNNASSGGGRPMAVRTMDRSNADFARRMRDPKRMTIRDWANGADIATHKMSWAEDDVSPYIFPVVQRHGNYLKDYSDPRYSYNNAAQIALQNGDYMRTSNPQEAEWLTTNYKDYYPGFKDPLVNASIGREYSMPDYKAVAMTQSPMYGIEWRPDDDELDYRDIRNRQLYLESAGKETSRSGKGAQGIFQIMPATAQWYKDSTGDVGDIWDPIYNERVRDWVMDRNWKSNVVKEGNPSNKTRMKKALAAYNYGVGNLKKALNKAKKAGVDTINGDEWLEYLPSETRNYVNFIMNGLDASKYKTQDKYQEWLGSGNKHIKAYGGPKDKQNVLRVNDEGLPEYTLPEVTIAYDLPDRNQDKQGFNKYVDSFVKSYTDGNIDISDINRLPFKYRNATLGKIESTRKQEMSSDFVKRKEFEDIQKKIKKYSPAYPLKTSYYSHYWLWNKEIDELRDIEKRMNNGDYWNADEMLQDLNRYEQIVSKRQNYKDAVKERDDYLSNYAGRYLNSRIPFIDPFKEDANSLPSQLFRYAKRHNLFGLNEDKHISQESKEMVGGKGTDIISLDNNVIRLSPESKQSSALFNEFVETQNPSIYRASDYKQGNVSTFGDSNIPTKNVSLFQGVEDGKFKIGNIEDFKDDTYVYPVRNIKKQYSAPIKRISVIQNGHEGVSKDYVDQLRQKVSYRTPYDGMVMGFYDQYDPWGGTKKESEAHWNSYNSTENIKYALKKHPEAAKYIVYKDKSGYTYNEIMQLINDGAFSNGNLWFEGRMPNYIYAAFDKARNNYPETKRLKEIYDKKFNELLEDTDNPYHTINEIRANLELERTKAYNDFIEKHPGLVPLENRENKYLVTDINDSTYNVSNLNASILDNKMVLGNPNGGVFIGRFQDISQPQLDSLNAYLQKNPSWISRNDLGSFDQYRLDSPSLGEYLKQYYENPSPNDPNVYVVGTTQPNKLWSNEYKKGGSIHIKPENRGKFTALKKRTGHSASWFKAHGTPAQKKMATFALNARKWHHKHPDGGSLFDRWHQYMQNNTIDVPMTFNLPEVQVTAQAPRPGDTNYDKYIANTYDAWKRGDVDINTLPTETRNRVRGYSGTIAAQKGMNTAAKVAGITAAIPAGIIGGISFAPTAWSIMNNPIVDAGLTIHGAINAPKNIREGVQELQEGNYGRGALDLGLTSLDLYGAGNLAFRLGRIANPAYRAKHAYNAIQPAGYEDATQRAKDWFKSMWNNPNIDYKNPQWYQKLKDNFHKGKYDYMDDDYLLINGYTGTGDKITANSALNKYLVNTGDIADKARMDAWAIYNGLPQQFGTYVKNIDGTYSYDLNRIDQMTNGNIWIPIGDKISRVREDFITGAGGNLEKWYRKSGDKYSGQGTTVIEDMWDLQPFKFQDWDLSRRLSDKLIEKHLIPKKIVKLYDKKHPYDIRYDGSVDYNFFPKLGQKFKDFEVGKLTGGKPFLMKTEVPWYIDNNNAARLNLGNHYNIRTQPNEQPIYEKIIHHL